MIILIFILYFFSRLYPYLLSPVPLGYDGGLYLYLFKSDYSLLWLRQSFPPFVYYLGKLLSLVTSPENIIIPLQLIGAVLLFISLYLYTKNNWTLLVFSLSSIQYRLWWYYYLKNLYALSLVFFYLYLDRQKSLFKYLFIILIIHLHQPTSVILFFILLFQKNLQSLTVFTITFIIQNYFQSITPYLGGIISTFNSASGTFYSLPQSLVYMLSYLPLAFYGYYLNLRSRLLPYLNWVFVISFLIPLFGLFLSRRFIPYFDIFAIVLAGIALKKISSKFKLIFIIVSLITFTNFVIHHSSSLILSDEFAEIKTISTTPENATILVTDNEYTPWIYGYSHRRTIAPGFGENDIYWRDSEWQQYWLSGSKKLEIDLLKKLPQPLYIWRGDRNAITKFSLEGDCFERFSWHLTKFICP